MADEQRWWETTPAILGGIAAVITAIAGLIVALGSQSVDTGIEPEPKQYTEGLLERKELVASSQPSPRLEAQPGPLQAVPKSTSNEAPTPHTSHFRLLYPISQSVVPANTIMLQGVGALPDDKVEVEIFTNDWYPQTGQTMIDLDGSWTYGPCYLSGQGAFNNHTVRVSLIRNGSRVASVTATGIRKS